MLIAPVSIAGPALMFSTPLEKVSGKLESSGESKRIQHNRPRDPPKAGFGIKLQERG